ncbi:MAG: hypothetical protein GQ582_09545 [Methyloprofundus sp.]|nr:hypothetical protein [Methyloprofundus sp.]
MTTKLSKTLIPVLSVAMLLLMVPEQADARRNGNRNKSVNRNKNVNRNTNINHNKNVNRNVNVNSNRNTNVNVNVNRHGGYYGGRRNYHPVATGLAIGAAAAVTSAIIGSIIYTLPTGCTTVIRVGISYRQCGNTWYQPQYAGNDVTYVVINQPY